MTEPQDVLAEAIGSVELGFWRETPIEDPDGVHGIEARFDVRAFAEAITAALAERGYRLAAARGEPGLREALDAFFEDIDADWTNDNIRPGDFAFRFRHAADRLRAALAPSAEPPETT